MTQPWTFEPVAGPFTFTAVVAEHPTPTNPTNCCFGEDDLATRFVTGYDGRLYRARTDRRGLRR